MGLTRRGIPILSRTRTAGCGIVGRVYGSTCESTEHCRRRGISYAVNRVGCGNSLLGVSFSGTNVRRADREAEGARLLSEYRTKSYLGFESPALRQNARPVGTSRRAFFVSDHLRPTAIRDFDNRVILCSPLTKTPQRGILSNCTRRYLSWIEDLTTNQGVIGSNPIRRTTRIQVRS